VRTGGGRKAAQGADDAASDGGDTAGGDDGGVNSCEDAATIYTDTCQVCGAEQCCGAYEACLEDASCACWFECMGSVYDENECVLQCGASVEMGLLLGCMDSACNDECVHWDSPSLN